MSSSAKAVDAEKESPLARSPSVSKRREAIAGESFDPSKLCDASVVTRHPKSSEQQRRIRAELASVVLFSSLDDESLDDVVDGMAERRCQRDEIVIQQGERGDFFYVVESGVYRVYVEEGDSKNLVGEYNGEGSFGELALMHNALRAATVVCRSPGIVWAMERVVFQRLVFTKAFNKRATFLSLLESVPMLKELSESERANLTDALTLRTYEDNEMIIRQGDEGSEMFFVLEGGVRFVVRRDSEEVEMPQRRDEKDEEEKDKKVSYFGELALLTKQPRAASVFARGPCRLAVLPVESFERLLGPCVSVMSRSIESYSRQLAGMFGDAVPDLRD